MNARLKDLPPEYQEQARDQLCAPTIKRGKYGARVTHVDGIRFPSKLESECYRWLQLRRAAGEVLWWTRQAIFDIEGGTYRVDFDVQEADGRRRLIDAKGHDTAASRKSRRQVLERWGIEVELWPART